MRVLRILGIALAGLIGLIIVLLLGVWLFVNPNNYKDRIEQLVKTSTGRELALPGAIKLSVFPWIALELGPASLGNPPGFGNQPFATLQRADVRVKFLPLLLHRQLVFGRIEIDGLDLRLQKNAKGEGNWQKFGAESTVAQQAPSAAPSPAAPQTPGAPSGSHQLPELAGVVIKDSRVSYEDTILDHFGLDVGRLTPGAAVPVSLRFDFTPSAGARPIPLASSFDLSVDRDAQTFSVPAFTAQLAAARLSGSARGSDISQAPKISGAFQLAPVSLRELMGELGLKPPDTRDPKVLARFAASGHFAYGDNAARLDALEMHLDDSTLRGDAAVTNLLTKALNFNLVLDRIDLDRYRAPPSNAPAEAAQPSTLPTTGLKTLQMNGALAIGQATVASLHMSDVHVRIAANKGIVRVAPVDAKLYGGAYSGTVTLDARGAVPAIALDQTMTGIDVAQLLQDFAHSRRISGRGNVTTHLTARGSRTDAITRSLNGHVAANVANGAVEGLDLGYEIDRALALVERRAPSGGKSAGRTAFNTFKASADITNGIAQTKDLDISSQLLHATGAGTANLITQAINYDVKVSLFGGSPAASGSAGKTLAAIPLTITGTITSPSVRPDLGAIGKAVLQQQLQKRKGELQQNLLNKLKGILK